MKQLSVVAAIIVLAWAGQAPAQSLHGFTSEPRAAAVMMAQLAPSGYGLAHALAVQDQLEPLSPLEQGLLRTFNRLFPQSVGHDQLVVRWLRIAGGVLFAAVIVAVSWVVGREHKKGRL